MWFRALIDSNMKEAQDNEAEIPASVDGDLLEYILHDLKMFPNLNAEEIDSSLVFELVNKNMC